MRIVFITRATLFTVPGGDTCQIQLLAEQLAKSHIKVDIKLANQYIRYGEYDLLHFFNITRPADILYHIHNTSTPFVVTPILVDYSEYDRKYRTGITGTIFKILPRNTVEYLKTIARWLTRTDKIVSRSFLWKGQYRSIQEIIERAAMLLPNSCKEQEELSHLFTKEVDYRVAPNGIDPSLFALENKAKESSLVLCVARIEGIKNQLNLIRALNNTSFRLLLIGSPAPNQQAYYKACQKIAASNITFIKHIPQQELVSYYQQATVHVLPSWFETCGLVSLEAGAMGCNIVITEKGYTREYFEDYAFYCDPSSPQSIRHAIEKAANAPFPTKLRDKILTHYTWQKAAEKTLAAYKQVLQKI